ncbi:ABC transporter permease [bacterium]|nr:ABC transporter permease [bacterium]
MSVPRPNNKRPAWILYLHVVCVYLFLYAPIIVLVLFSFNTDRRNATWQGFTFNWYYQLFCDENVLRALGNSLKVGLTSTVIATFLGTLAAIGLSKYQFKFSRLAGSLAYLPLVVPEIVMGISILTLFLSLGIKLSLMTIILAHIAFCISYVVVIVRTALAGLDKSLEEAAADLGANRWETFRYVIFPQILPGIVSGALLCFTLSFDDFVIAFFNAGVGSGTLPMAIHSMLKFGITPEINAISTIMLAVNIIMIIIVKYLNAKDR